MRRLSLLRDDECLRIAPPWRAEHHLIKTAGKIGRKRDIPGHLRRVGAGGYPARRKNSLAVARIDLEVRLIQRDGLHIHGDAGTRGIGNDLRDAEALAIFEKAVAPLLAVTPGHRQVAAA